MQSPHHLLAAVLIPLCIVGMMGGRLLKQEREKPPKWGGGGVMLTFLQLAHMEIPSALQLILENSEIWYGPCRRFLENKGFLDVKCHFLYKTQ